MKYFFEVHLFSFQIRSNFRHLVAENPCYPNPCINGGSCETYYDNNEDIKYYCVCEPGYSGVHCDLGKMTFIWYLVAVHKPP